MFISFLISFFLFISQEREYCVYEWEKGLDTLVYRSNVTITERRGRVTVETDSSRYTFYILRKTRGPKTERWLVAQSSTRYVILRKVYDSRTSIWVIPTKFYPTDPDPKGYSMYATTECDAPMM